MTAGVIGIFVSHRSGPSLLIQNHHRAVRHFVSRQNVQYLLYRVGIVFSAHFNEQAVSLLGVTKESHSGNASNFILGRCMPPFELRYGVRRLDWTDLPDDPEQA